MINSNKIAAFVAEHDVDYSKDTVDAEMLARAEKTIGVHFGKQLREYLLSWGYLGFDFVELCGINPRQGLSSDMVTQTIYIHTYFPSTISHIFIENRGGGEYALADERDNIFLFNTEDQVLCATHMTLYEYILNRFSEV